MIKGRKEFMFERKMEKKIEEKVELWLSAPELGWLNDFKQALPEAEFYLVGGCLRDAARGQESKDLDFVVRLASSEKIQEVLSGLGSIVLVGKRFGVFKFRPQGFENIEFDIALPRLDYAFGTGGYKDVDTQSNPNLPLEHDLARRDFTINALAYSLKEKKIIDPYHGLADLKKKIIRTVGDPRQRFLEDYSRLLRAVRFESVIDGQIEPETFKVLVELIEKINERRNIQTGEVVVDTERQKLIEPWAYILPGEIIVTEMVKTLVAKPTRFWESYSELKIWEKLIPEFFQMKGCQQTRRWHGEGDVYEHMKLVLKSAEAKPVKEALRGAKLPVDVLVAALFHDLAKPTTYMETSTGHHFYGHEQVGAKRWSELQQIFPFGVAGVDTEAVRKLIANHMQINESVYDMQKKTILKYFGGELGQKQIIVGLMDCLASWQGRFKRPDLSKIVFIQKQLKKLAEEGFVLPQEKMTLKKPLINGRQIMSLWHIDQSKPESRVWIGLLKNAAWEAELEDKITRENVGVLPPEELKAIIIASLASEQKENYEKIFNK